MTVRIWMSCDEHGFDTIRVPDWMRWWLPMLHMRLHHWLHEHEED